MENMSVKAFFLTRIFLLTILFVFASPLSSNFYERTSISVASEAPQNSNYWIDEEVQSAMGADFDNYTLTGNGTSDAPYLIQSETDLAFLSWTIYNGKVFDGGNQTSSYWYYDQYFKQTVDLDLSLYYWQPIGIHYTRNGASANRHFSGNYDGDGHTISGLFTPAGSKTGNYYQGLFGYVEGYNSYILIISNIKIIDSFVQGSSSIGGVVGSNNNAIVANCYNEGDVVGTSNVGGVVGINSNSIITNCNFSGQVSATSQYAGGVAAMNNSGATVISCNNWGSVNGNIYSGGIVGFNNSSTVTCCYNLGSVNGYSYVGGVVGYNNNQTITNCYNTGVITGTNYVGGIIGRNNNGMIANCGVECKQLTGSSSVGIICGDNNSTNPITNCFGIVDFDLSFLGNGTSENCVWITSTGKYYIGSDFSDFVWINQDSCPIPKSLSSIGNCFIENITNQLLTSSEWQPV